MADNTQQALQQAREALKVLRRAASGSYFLCKEELDEIDASIREVDAALSLPVEAPSESVREQAVGFVSPVDMAKLESGVAVTIYPGTIDPRSLPLYASPLPAWQPIESGPQNGQSVLVAEGDYVDVGFWNDGSECYGHRGGPGWFSEDDKHNLLTARNIHPTHWMPFPEPPKESGNG